MKNENAKRWIALLLACVLCLALFAACKKSETADAPKDNGQNPVMNVIGDYINDRCSMTIEATGENGAKITAYWGETARDGFRWELTGTFDEATKRINYSDAVKKSVTYTDVDVFTENETIFENGAGYIQVNDDGTLTWNDAQDADMAFEPFEPVAADDAQPAYDYLVLVNKQTKLPDDWEAVVELEDATNSVPEDVELNEDNEYVATDVFKVEKKALEAFRALQADLEKDGIIILLDSTYRSVARQEELWKEFEEEYGLEYCQKYVAVPGYSEHHTGLAIDVCLLKDGVIINDNDQMIAEKEIFGQIHARLADFGFILRYPEGKEDITGYGFEPWHFRYVGVDAAKEITQAGVTLDEYLAQKAAD